MSDPDRRLIARHYWRLFLTGAVLGIAASVAIIHLIAGAFWTRGEFGDSSYWTAVGVSLAIGAVSAGFVLIATWPFRRFLYSHRGWIVTLSTVSPLALWPVAGFAYSHMINLWDFYTGYVVIALVSAAGAGILSAMLTFFLPPLPQRESAAEGVEFFDGGTAAH